MQKFNDINQTTIFVPIIAFQLSVDSPTSYSWQIKLFFTSQELILKYTNFEKYNTDCKQLLNL